MKKILFILFWVLCIGLLSSAYGEFIESEFRIQKVQGFIKKKGTETAVSNLYGNYQDEKQYWIEVLDEKIAVTKEAYQGLRVYDEVIVSRTKHGVLVEKL
jgi:hypothetical protein